MESFNIIKKISVLTSLYRGEQFLEGYFRALSKINGTEQMEVLLLHNDPQANEIEIVSQYLPAMPFVRHILIPQREGLYATWNRGIKLAQGEYVTIWNIDDVRFPDSVLQQAEALDKNPEAALAYGDIWVSNTYGVCGSVRTNVPLYNENKFFFKSYGMSCFQMWRKSIHDIIGYYDEQFKCVADFDFQIRVALHFSFIKIKEPLGIYLENQPHKLSFNGLQELENNIIYLRYGVYKKINLFFLRLSCNRYKKNELLFFNTWQPFTERKSFNIVYRYAGWIYSIINSMVKYIKLNIIIPLIKKH